MTPLFTLLERTPSVAPQDCPAALEVMTGLSLFNLAADITAPHGFAFDHFSAHRCTSSCILVCAAR